MNLKNCLSGLDSDLCDHVGRFFCLTKHRLDAVYKPFTKSPTKPDRRRSYRGYATSNEGHKALFPDIYHTGEFARTKRFCDLLIHALTEAGKDVGNAPEPQFGIGNRRTKSLHHLAARCLAHRTKHAADVSFTEGLCCFLYFRCEVLGQLVAHLTHIYL